MPYLHWETDRSRAKFDQIMRNLTELHRKKMAKLARKGARTSLARSTDNKGNRILDGTVNRHTRIVNGRSYEEEDSNLRMIATTTEVMDAKFRDEKTNNPNSKFSKSRVARRLTPGVLTPTSVLGQIFHRAAILCETMDYYQEREMLKDYLHHDPPFHPRRTLDQSYYWTLKTTKKRDRDQVVYRGTAPKKEFLHSGAHCSVGCSACREDIRKVPRVIMVDQLWMWILDGSE